MKDKKEYNKDGKNFLLYIPEIKYNNYKVDKNNIVTLYFEHNKSVERFARWLVKKNNISDIVFDEKSSLVWLLIDGKRSIYEIMLQMSRQLGDTEEVAIERLVMYIRYIARKGWIKFIGIKSKEDYY
jgi:hypothetical protein